MTLRKFFAFTGLCACFLAPVKADEGMWVPILLQRNEADMQKQGLQLNAEDIYSINNSCLKDAIVQFGGGCTGEVVSNQGLLFTNHHCGFGQIQSHSSLENDYLRNGFWAATLQEELPCPGLSVTFLISMEDVTSAVLGEASELYGLSEKERADSIKQRCKRLIDIAQKGTHYKASIKPFYYGNQYFMFINETFEDVRMVGAPPSNIGKFGGDTDNWVWPRHTGDFSLFRIYADSNNKPAPYSASNKPYKPRYSLPISISDLQENDFTFVFGYPGRTQEYLSSYAIKHISEVENPLRIAARTERLKVINSAMDQDALTRIKYAAKAASISNGWKKWMGENKGLKRLGTIDKKEAFEKEFKAWTMTEQGLAYKGILPALKQAYDQLQPYSVMSLLFNEVGSTPELIKMAARFIPIVNLAQKKDIKDSLWTTLLEKELRFSEGFYKNFDAKVDENIFTALSTMDKGLGGVIPDQYTQSNLYAKSLFIHADEVNKLLQTPFSRRSALAKSVEKDIAYKYAKILYGQYRNQTLPVIREIQAEIDSLQRIYMDGQMKMQASKMFYPDANFTLRVAYGKIAGFSPSDAVYYAPFTTIEGIMQKEDPNIYDYVVEDKLKELYNTKNYGRYATATGTLPVAFIATNHTTGGNSGSPVLNGKGELIGLNFDRNWEGTMSDLHYDPSQCRNIVLDVRYCLFIIDKFAGAQRLINELDIRE